MLHLIVLVLSHDMLRLTSEHPHLYCYQFQGGASAAVLSITYLNIVVPFMSIIFSKVKVAWKEVPSWFTVYDLC